jgi:regulator of replication initiation timing
VIGFLVLLVILGASLAGVAVIDRADKEKQRLRLENRRLRHTLGEVDTLAREHFELNSTLSQCIRDEINKLHADERKELT